MRILIQPKGSRLPNQLLLNMIMHLIIETDGHTFQVIKNRWTMFQGGIHAIEILPQFLDDIEKIEREMSDVTKTKNSY